MTTQPKPNTAGASHGRTSDMIYSLDAKPPFGIN